MAAALATYYGSDTPAGILRDAPARLYRRDREERGRGKIERIDEQKFEYAAVCLESHRARVSAGGSGEINFGCGVYIYVYM